MSVLIVEDDPDIANVMAELLAREGYVTEVAATGEQAFEVIRSSAGALVMIADERLPGMSGSELVRSVRAMLRPDLPAAIMSGMRRDRLDLPADVDFLGKPFDLEDLLQFVRNHLAGAR